jgi:putative ABC transport system permease protein
MGKVTLKGLVAHKLRFMLTALAVMLGVAFVSGTLILTDTISKVFDDLFASVYEGTDAVVRSRESIDVEFGGGEQRSRVSEDLLPEVEQVQGVRAADGNLQFYAQMVDRKGDAIGTPEQGAPTLGFNWSDVRELNPFRLKPGGSAPRGPDQIVIDARTADNESFDVGDRVQVLTAAPPKRYEVVGIATFGEEDSLAGATAVLFDTPTAQSVSFAPDQFDSVSVVADDGISEQEIRNRIAQSLDDPSLQVLTGEQITKEEQDSIQEDLQFFNIALLIFALVALFVGSFIILNTFSIVVAQRTRELALLRAVGASGRQVTTSVLVEAVIVGLLASIVGFLAGLLLSAGLKGLLSAFGFDLPASGIVVQPDTVVIALLVGTLVSLFSAVVPARRAARVPPVAAIRDVAVESRGHSVRRVVIGLGILVLGIVALLSGLLGDAGVEFVGIGVFLVFIGVFVLGPVIARPLSAFLGAPLPRWRGVPGAIARENALRNPKRTSATAAALMVGVALVSFITIFAESTKATINTQIDRAFRADFVISTGGFGSFDAGFSPDLAAEVARLPQVSNSTALRFNEAEFDGSGAFFAAFDPRNVDELFDLQPVGGSFDDLGDGDLAVSTEEADSKGWQVGDDVRVKFPSGETTLPISVLYETGQKQGLSDYGMSLGTYDEHYPQRLDQQVYVKLAGGVSLEQGRRALDRVVRPYPNAEVQDQSQFKADQAEQINQLLGLVYVLLLLAIVIALIGIANTLALSIFERTRELGLLRAVGMTRPQLRSSVRWESVIIALMGTVLGVVIGIFFSWALVEALKDEGITEWSPPPGQLILIVIIGALAGALAAVSPARRAAKLDVLKAVSTE